LLLSFSLLFFASQMTSNRLASKGEGYRPSPLSLALPYTVSHTVWFHLKRVLFLDSSLLLAPHPLPTNTRRG
jgi:hypothetical protein